MSWSCGPKTKWTTLWKTRRIWMSSTIPSMELISIWFSRCRRYTWAHLKGKKPWKIIINAIPKSRSPLSTLSKIQSRLRPKRNWDNLHKCLTTKLNNWSKKQVNTLSKDRTSNSSSHFLRTSRTTPFSYRISSATTILLLSSMRQIYLDTSLKWLKS